MRIKLNEISSKRILEAIGRRLKNIPHVLNWYFSKEGINNRRKLSKLYNIHKGERCFLIANGPSLANMDLSILKNEKTFAMNRLYLIFDKLEFIPNYYCVTNELVLQQFAEDLQKVPSKKFFNWTERNFFQSNENLSFLRLNYAFKDSFSDDIQGSIFSGGTVTYASLQLIYFMGFSEVIIIGLDHNFAEKGRPNKTEVRQEKEDLSHFHPNYFPKGIKWQLPDLLRSEIAYFEARKAYEADGRKIIDATTGGKCDIFEKESFESVVNRIKGSS